MELFQDSCDVMGPKYVGPIQQEFLQPLQKHIPVQNSFVKHRKKKKSSGILAGTFFFFFAQKNNSWKQELPTYQWISTANNFIAEYML